MKNQRDEVKIKKLAMQILLQAGWFGLLLLFNNTVILQRFSLSFVHYLDVLGAAFAFTGIGICVSKISCLSQTKNGSLRIITQNCDEERIMKGVLALRDAVHNLPFYLNLTHAEDAVFCHDVFSQAHRLLGGPASCRFHLTDEQCARLRGQTTLSGAPICDEDFKMSAQGDMVAALRITRVILWMGHRKFMPQHG